MSRNFIIFIVGVIALFLVLFAVRVAFFKYDESYTYFYNLNNNTIVYRQNIEHREWLAGLLRDYDFNVKNGPRLYIVPLVFPEIKYRFPYKWKEVKFNSDASNIMIKLRSGWPDVTLISIRWDITPGKGSSIVYLNNSGITERVKLDWAQTKTVLNVK